LVTIDFDEEAGKLIFMKQTGKMIVSEAGNNINEEELLSRSDAVGLPLPQAQAAASGKGNRKSNGENQES
jgi:hypothetical protein